ncbi:SpoIIE family protein phosphatase [Frankia sp. Ag45/Mut15]|uniref:SpoIIE family protein phosphatase n=1 Tax=Frankia umida TaxID=573489 RepID=A0ABT0JSK9_9ACTN|nr:SpoIIE family protein phosphatase [Frankia umida]MCK9874541.1 SpoIIE family protein phosphatase [Frankia umida]
MTAGSERDLTPVERQAWQLLQTMPVGFIAWDGDWRCNGVNPAGERLCGRSREELLGRSLWEIFPAVVGTEFETVYRRVARLRKPENIEIYYPEPLCRWLDIHVIGDIEGTGGVVAYFLDVTERHEILERERSITRSLLHASAERDVAARQAATLAEVALALTSVDTVEALEAVVVGQGLATLGADGGAVVSPDETGNWRITLNAALGERARLTYSAVPYDSPLPSCWTARTGRRVLLPTVASGHAFDPIMADVYADTARLGWAILPLTVQGEVLGSLAAAWVDEHEPSASELDLLDGFAAQCAQALHRIRATQQERQTAREVRELAEALQLALLTPPPTPAGLQIEVRYQSAQDAARVGGDWYDAFEHTDGSTVLVIGDVTGHDSTAAAKMAQLRGLLRTLAYTADLTPVADGRIPADRSPASQPSASQPSVSHVPAGGQDRPDRSSPLAAVLSALEHTAAGLGVDALATVVLVRVEAAADPGDSDADSLRTRTVHWCNAGHLPPILVHADGSTEILETARTDLLLGFDTHADRHDHSAFLPPGAVLLLYTDGLVERRGTSLDEGLDALRGVLTGLATEGLTTESPAGEGHAGQGIALAGLCDGVLAAMAPRTGEDDIALLALRAAPLYRSFPAGP